MGKLLVAIIFAVLIVGCCMYVMVSKILPATGTAGDNTKAVIESGF